MFTRKKEIYKSMGIVAMLTLGTTSALEGEPLTQTQLHAVLGGVTNFILDDGIVHNGTSYGKVTSPYTGRVWLNKNLGATQVCTSFDDVACYGDYYQWGRNADGHEKSNSFDVPTLANNVTNVGHKNFITTSNSPYDWISVDVSGAGRSVNWSATDGNSVCPTSFRVPSIAELKAELLDIGSAQIANNTDAFNSFLKLPSAGYRYYATATLTSLGFWGLLWSSSINGSSTRGIYFSSDSAYVGIDSRAFGFAVRCIKAQVHQHNGVTYGEVISPYTGKVWLDRNLGASKICTSSADTACYGDYYQWGRNFDGHQKSTSNSTSALASNVINIGHGDFITSSGGDWASVDATGAERVGNWAVTDGSSICPIGFRVPILAELKAELLDVGSAHIANNADAFNSFLKLPSTSYRGHLNGSIVNAGLFGNMWSSSASGNVASYLYFDSVSAASYNDIRALGISVRCLKN